MSLQEKLSYFDERLKVFYPLIGGWPPNLASPAQVQMVRVALEQDLAHAVALYTDHPQETSAKLVLAELLRMGHNMDVPDCARRADAVLTEIFRIDQFNIKAMVCRASMYVSLHPDLLPDAERLFAKVIALTTPNVDPMAHQGLAFACLKQDKVDQAIVHFEAYLEQVPAHQRIVELVAKLKAGHVGKVTFYPSQSPADSPDAVATPRALMHLPPAMHH